MSSPQLNFDTEQLSSMELYSLQLQKVIADFTEFDAVTKAYVDDKVAQAKSDLTDGATAALDTFKELEDYLTASGVAGGLVEQIAALSASIATEQTRAQSAEASLQSSLTSEVNRATAKENALQSEVDTTQVALGVDSEGKYQASSTAHYISSATTFKSADDLLDAQVKILDNDIAGERTRAEGEESRIEGKVDAEVLARTAADASLQTQIDTLSAGQSSDSSAAQAERAGIKYAALGTQNVGDKGDGTLRYFPDSDANYFSSEGSNPDLSLAKHVNQIDREVKLNKDVIGQVNPSGNKLWFGLASEHPKYMREETEQKSTIAEDVVGGFKILAGHLETEVDATTADRALIRSELATERGAREAADASLQTSINAEASTRFSQNVATNQAINNEKARAEAAEFSLGTALGEEQTRAQNAEAALQGELNAQKIKQDDDYNNNVNRLDGHEADIQALGERPHNASIGGFDIQHDDLNPQDNKYIYFSRSWRLHGSSDGSRLVFEYNKGTEEAPNFVSAVPFISHV